jgi:hypothetical protein
MTSLAILEGGKILDVFWGCRTIKKLVQGELTKPIAVGLVLMPW